MDKRFVMTLATGMVLTLPLLAGCGGTTTPEASPAASQAVPSSTAPSSGTTSSAPSSEPTSSASPSADPAQEKTTVQAASAKFFTTALTVGYPDKTFADYTDRIKPLVTDSAYRSIKDDKSIQKEAKELKTLYAQKARTYPELDGDPKISDLTEDSAHAKVSYRLKVQQKQGGDWKTVQTQPKSSISVALVKKDGTWLADDAL